MEDKEKIAVNAANVWCRCFKCDGRVNATGCACEKDKRLTCHKWYDGYRTALLALEDDRVLDSTDAFIEKAVKWLDDLVLSDYVDIKETSNGTFVTFDQDKLVKDFRNYMKGE